ncbi:response regulator transcription factor [Acidaminobacter sp. JC074]|uniref:response regulator n=1 Tax=Acidaminobacter sp. JC074 TaxID=2530199 RepID=UPI001F0ECD18|nr:response regulator transcription factor [Acidaminobacter sp. JC074]MCH4890435.1 response regulator transcription factor [Acidaminobacter sp. JC074]
MSDNVIRVMIADDYEIIREGIKRVLSYEEDISIVAESIDGNDVINKVDFLKPDVLLLDMSMPGHSGLEILRALRKKGSDIKIIMLTIERGADIINQAIESGADGYVVKESTTAEIVEAIHSVHEGKKYLDKSLMEMMFNKYKDPKDQSVFKDLSKRELQILFYVSKGLNNKEIADELFISESTVKNNVSRILKKMDFKDRVHAAIYGVTHHIDQYI